MNNRVRKLRHQVFVKLDTIADRCPSLEQPELAVSVREEAALVGGGTTGLTSWPAGRALAQWLDKPAIHQLLEEGLGYNEMLEQVYLHSHVIGITRT